MENGEFDKLGIKRIISKLSVVEDITMRRLIWERYAWRKKGSLLRTILGNAPQGKIPLERPRLR